MARPRLPWFVALLLPALLQAAPGPEVIERFLPDPTLLAGDHAPIALPARRFEELRRRLGDPLPAYEREGEVVLSPARGVLRARGPGEPLELEITRSARIRNGTYGRVPVAGSTLAVLSLTGGVPGEAAPRALEVDPDGSLHWRTEVAGTVTFTFRAEVPPRADGTYPLPPLPGPGGAVSLVSEDPRRALRSPGPGGALPDLLPLPEKSPFPLVLALRSPATAAPPPAPRPPRVTRPVAAWTVLAEVDHASTHVRARATVTQPGLGTDHLTLEIPRAARVRSVTGPALRSWEPVREGRTPEHRSLRLHLREKLRGKTRVEVDLDLPLGVDPTTLELAPPRLVGAQRQSAWMALAARAATELDVEAATGRDVVPIGLEDLPGELGADSRAPLLAGYRSSGPAPRVTLPLTRREAFPLPRLIVSSLNGVTVLVPGEDAGGEARLSIVTKLVFRVKNLGARFLDLELPGGAEVLSAAVDRRPIPPLLDPERPGRLRIPVPTSPPVGDDLGEIPVQIAYRHDRAGSPGARGSLALAQARVHAHVAQASHKVYTPPDLRVLAYRGDLDWQTLPAPFAAAEATNLLFEEVVEPLLALLLLGLVAGAGAWISRHENTREALGRALDLLRSRVVPLILVTLFMGLMMAITVPNFRAARERSNVRACFANQKTLAGAIEMYNLDFNTSIEVLDDELLTTLKREGYLQSIPLDPGQGARSAAHYLLSAEGNGIVCRVHGSIHGGVRTARFYNQAAADGDLPVGKRTTPVDVAIPVVGEEALLERGFLESGAPLEVVIDYVSRDHLGRLRAGAVAVGVLLAGLLLAARGRRGSRGLAGAGTILGVVAWDHGHPALAGAFLAGCLGTLGLVALVALIRRIPSWAQAAALRLGGPPTRGAAAATALLLAAGGAGATPPIEVLRLHGMDVPGKVLISPETHARLLRGRPHPHRPSPVPPHPLRSVRVTLSPDRAHVDAALAIEVARGHRWIPLHGIRAEHLLDAASGGVPVPIETRDGFLHAAPFPADGTLELRLRIPRRRAEDGSRISLPLPRATLAELAIEGTHDGRVLVAGALLRTPAHRIRPRGEPVEVHWEKRTAPDAALDPARRVRGLEVASAYLAEPHLAGLRVRGRVHLESGARGRGEVTLALPAGWTCLEARGPGLTDWEVREGRLAVLLASPEDSVPLELEFEVERGGRDALALGLPEVEGAAIEERTLAVAVPADQVLEIAPLPEGVEPVAASDLPGGLVEPAGPALRTILRVPPEQGRDPVLRGVLRALGAVALQTGSVDVARVRTILQSDGRVIHALRLQVKNLERQFLRVTPPEGVAVYSTHVGGRAVHAAAGPDGAVLIPLARSRLRQGAPIPFAVELVLGSRLPEGLAAGFALALPRVDLPVGSLRWALELPKGTRLADAETNATRTAAAAPVSFAEGTADASTPTLRLPVRAGDRVVHLSKDLLRPSDPPVALRARLAREGGRRETRLVTFTAAALLILVLLGLFAGGRHETRVVAVVGGLATLGVTALSLGTGAAGPALRAALGAFDGCLLHVLTRLAWGHR